MSFHSRDPYTVDDVSLDELGKRATELGARTYRTLHRPGSRTHAEAATDLPRILVSIVLSRRAPLIPELPWEGLRFSRS